MECCGGNVTLEDASDKHEPDRIVRGTRRTVECAAAGTSHGLDARKAVIFGDLQRYARHLVSGDGLPRPCCAISYGTRT
jgi:hypothetical protein